MRLKNTFVGSKLQKDLDERLVQNGEYPDALNIRVANTDSSDVGAIENVKGNEKLTNLLLTNAKTIGAFSDGSNQKIYWFVTSDDKDLVMEFDEVTGLSTTVLEATDDRLGFSPNNLITGVVKIINSESSKDLLIWTDDLNPPRCINIERAKTYSVDGFDEFDINLIKRPPTEAPTCVPVSTGGEENNLENKFYAFAYRYKYLDGEYSALSSFSNYQFYPSEFKLDFQTMENEGMVNTFNAIDIDFNTGDKRVTDIELVFKETNSNTVYLIETLNKVAEGWNNDETQSFRFSNNKINISLPSDELTRLYDNVPLTAKSLELVGTRLMFGNYVEQYDLKDLQGNDVNVDYDLSIESTPLEGTEFSGNGINEDILFDLSGIELKKGKRLTFEFSLVDNPLTFDPNVNISFQSTPFTFVLGQDYANAAALVVDPDFQSFATNTMTEIFTNNYTAENPPTDSTVIDISSFSTTFTTTDTVRFILPQITFEIDNGVDPVTQEIATLFADTASGLAREDSVDSSLKTNRSYEAAIIYLDEYNRASTALTDDDNTIYIPQEFSTSKNKIRLQIKNRPPEWAKKYKIALKQDRGNYNTIYTNLFYEDGLFRWVKLEGANVNKVQEGDTLIVKSDLGGALDRVEKVRVLELDLKQPDFIEDNVNSNGDEIIEEGGLYMKIKPSNIDMNFSELTVQTYEGSQHQRYPSRCYTSGEFGETNNGVFTPFELNAGARINIRINFSAQGSISYNALYERSFRVNGNYASVKDWFETEVGDLGSFGADYTWNGFDDIGSNILNQCGYGQAQTNNYISGYGFARNCSDSDPVKFYVVAHRAGTTTRNITTNVSIEITNSDGILIFETEGEENQSDIFFETEETFTIQDGKHLGNIQDQDLVSNDAIIELNAHNCYVQGNGAESYRFKDAFNVGFNDEGQKVLANYLNIDLRPTAKSLEKYQQIRRLTDITYSEPYNENTSINRLNEFNLSKANFKDDIDRSFGSIQYLHSRDTDLVVFQEDKVSKVLYGKDLMASADGGGTVSTIENVLGQQVPYSGEYGISKNPESFSSNGYNMYFTDSKRGAVLRLGRDGINEISGYGLRTFYRDEFRNAVQNEALGEFDPHLDQYVVCNKKESGFNTLTFDEQVKGWTSRHSYNPDFMIGMNNEFYTFSNGELYLHHSNTALRNNYYGVQYPSTVTIMHNAEPSTVKLAQAVMLEGNQPWSTTMTAFITSTDDVQFSTISIDEYKEKEGMWYAYVRRNEATHFDSKSSYGIGLVTSFNPVTNEVIINGYNSSLNVGDILLNDALTELGEITAVDTNNDITTVILTGTLGLAAGQFVLGTKDNRIEGGGLRGYTIKVELESNVTNKAELFAVNTEVKKSFS